MILLIPKGNSMMGIMNLYEAVQYHFLLKEISKKATIKTLGKGVKIHTEIF